MEIKPGRVPTRSAFLSATERLTPGPRPSQQMGNCAPQARESGQDLADKTQAGGLTGSTSSSAGDLEHTALFLGLSKDLLQPPALHPETPESYHPMVLGSLKLRPLPQHGGFWAKFSPSTYKARNHLHHISPAQLPAKQHTRHSLPTALCHQGGGDRVTSALTAKSQPSLQLYCLCPPVTS